MSGLRCEWPLSGNAGKFALKHSLGSSDSAGLPAVGDQRRELCLCHS